MAAAAFAVFLSSVALSLQTPAPTPYLDAAVAQIQAEVPSGDARSLASAARVYVEDRVLPQRWGKGIRPTDVEGYLRDRAGLCGAQVAVYVALMTRLGVRSRAVEFYIVADGRHVSHATAEVWWSGRWHMEDVTWNTVFKAPGSDDPLSTAQVMALPVVKRDADRRTGHQNGWLTIYSRTADPFAYIHDPVDVVVDHTGTVEVPYERGRFVFDNVPNWFGRIPGSATPLGSQRFAFSTTGSGVLTLSGTSGCATGTVVATSALKRTVTIDQWTNTLRLGYAGPVTVGVESADPCYMVVHKVEETPTASPSGG